MSSKPNQVIVILPNGEKIMCPNPSTLWELKESIQNITGYSVSDQRIFQKDKKLKPQYDMEPDNEFPYYVWIEEKEPITCNLKLKHLVEQWMTAGEKRENIIEKYGSIEDWNVSQLTTMNSLFYRNTHFNEDITEWDTKNVGDTTSMFHYAEDFNQDISGWRFKSKVKMTSMFAGAKRFNQNIGKWDKIRCCSGMFDGAESFNQPIGGWDTHMLIDMENMFRDAKAFNQDLSSWKVFHVVSIKGMFKGASNFDKASFSPKGFMPWILDL